MAQLNQLERIEESAIGPLAVVTGERGLAAILLGDHDLILRAYETTGVETEERSTERTREAVRAVLAYLDGDESLLAAMPLDLRVGTEFQREVWRVVKDVPRGESASYGEIARRVGRPGAARAVGAAVGRNPLPLLVPCHRVLAAHRRLGGFANSAEWGLPVKRALLSLEGTSWVE